VVDRGLLRDGHLAEEEADAERSQPPPAAASAVLALHRRLGDQPPVLAERAVAALAVRLLAVLAADLFRVREALAAALAPEPEHEPGGDARHLAVVDLRVTRAARAGRTALRLHRGLEDRARGVDRHRPGVGRRDRAERGLRGLEQV